MLCQCRLIYIFGLFLLTKIEASEDQWVKYEKNNITYKVRQGTEYNIDSLESVILAPKSIADIEDMEALIIRNTDLEEIEPGAFDNLPNLKRLHLISIYKMKKIGRGAFNNLNITQLELTYGYLSDIASDAFDNMTSLESVFMYSINLKQWQSDWFVNTPALREIYVNFNDIEDIPADAFKNINQENAVTISFYRNKIKTIHVDAFKGLKKIKILTLAKNNIENWDENCLNGIEVGSLRIRDNKIRCFKEDAFDNIFAAKSTDIRGNPLEEKCLDAVNSWAGNHTEHIVKLT